MYNRKLSVEPFAASSFDAEAWMQQEPADIVDFNGAEILDMVIADIGQRSLYFCKPYQEFKEFLKSVSFIRCLKCRDHRRPWSNFRAIADGHRIEFACTPAYK
jgi:hypothetical protein